MTRPTLSGIAGLLAVPDVAIDMGTANTRVLAGSRIVRDVPTAVDRRDSDLAGNFIQQQSKTELQTVSPVDRGIVVDVSSAKELLSGLLEQVLHTRFIRPRVMICAPGDLSNEDRASLVDSVPRTFARSIVVGDAALAAAIGAGLDISSPYAQMLVDIGHGRTDIAVIRKGVVVQRSAIEVGGLDLHRAVQEITEEKLGRRVSPREAEEMIFSHGLVGNDLRPPARRVVAAGSVLKENDRRIESQHIREAIQPVVEEMIGPICQTLKELAPGAGAEVVENGIGLTGGVAQLRGLASYLSERTHLPVRVAPFPLHSVVIGAGQLMKTLTQTGSWRHFDVTNRCPRTKAARPVRSSVDALAGIRPHAVGSGSRLR